MADDPITQAKAYLAAQGPGELPDTLPIPERRAATEVEQGLAHYLLEQVAEIADQVAEIARNNGRMNRAVIQFGGRTRVVIWAIVVLGAAMAVMGGMFISRNQQAIRVSCTLLGNAVIQSGAGGQSNQPPTPVARAVAERQAILISAIQRKLLTSRQMARLKELDRIITRAGGVVAIPRCDEIVADPGSVRSLLRPVK